MTGTTVQIDTFNSEIFAGSFPPVIQKMIAERGAGTAAATRFFMSEKMEFREGRRELLQEDDIFFDKWNDFGPFFFRVGDEKKAGTAFDVLFFDAQ